MNLINPATGETIKAISEDSPESVEEKFLKARDAQSSWAETPLRDRKKTIERFAELLEAKKEDLAKTLTLEMGKPIAQSRNELNAVQGRIKYFLNTVGAALEVEKVFEDPGKMEERISREPLGVIANISAWNYPYFVGSNVFIPALLTGNAVLYKPSEYASLTGLAIAELFSEAGLPSCVFTPLIGGGAIGAALVNQAVHGIFFTGSYPTGKRIAEAAAGRMIKVQLELGGKDPTYVCEDAAIENAAASLADGAMYNTGQSCCSVERIYVHEDCYDRFIEAFVKVVRGFQMGDPTDERTYLGPLARKQQLQVLEEQVQDAYRKGAKVLIGGKTVSGKGNYFQATVLGNVNSEMLVMREESFGPIIGIQSVRGDQEAIELMNDSTYGLTAGVFTPDRERAEKILARIQAGTVYWNCCDRVSPNLPWTGRKHSGMGSTLGREGILAFTQPKAWHFRMAQ